MSKKKETTVQFEFSYSPDYKDFFVVGAKGGLQNGYHLHLEFYEEKRRLPSREELKIITDKDGNVLDQKPVDLESSEAYIVDRVYLVGLNLPFHSVKELHNYLGQRIKEIESYEDQTVDTRRKTKEKNK